MYRLVEWRRAMVRQIKVAFFSFFPPTLWTPGGGEVRLSNTERALRQLGVDVVLFDIWSRRCDFSILHCFGSTYELSGFVEAAKGLGMKVVVDVIAYSTKPCWQWRLWRVLDQCIPFPTIYLLRQKIYDLADRLIVMSHAELKQLCSNFRIDTRKVRVVPPGIDRERFSTADPELFVKQYGLKDFILEVSRINRHKGQARLIRALVGKGLNLVFIGPLDPTDPQGVEEFLELANRYSCVHYLGPISHDDPTLAAAYAAARVHVLPSVSESFGLVVLESIAAGTAAVTGRYPALYEYLGDHAYYCDPLSISDIRKSVLEAYNKGPKPGAQEYVLMNFSWKRVAIQLCEIYRELIA